MTTILNNDKHNAARRLARLLPLLLPLLSCALLLASCFSDDSTGFDNEVSDISVSGIDEEYTKTAYIGERLEISPVVEAGYGDAQMDYQWMLCDGNYLTDRLEVPANSRMSKATAFATNGQTARYIYFTTGDKLYGYNFANADFSEVEMPLRGIGQGETIAYVANQFVAKSGSSNFDHLIVGTQKGNEYKLYFYDMIGGVPDGDPVRTVQGTGKVRAVRSLTPGARLSYLMFSYYIYPIND